MTSEHVWCGLLLLSLGAGACAQGQTSRGTETATAAPMAVATDPKALDDKLSLLLGGRDLIAKEDLDRLAAPAELNAAFIRLANDPAQSDIVRSNALTSLRFHPAPEGKAALEAALLAPGTPDATRRSAVKAYGAGWKDEAIPVVAQLLAHPDLHTRNAAARALGDVRTPAAQQALRARLPQEKEALVRATIEAGLK
jgi:HEAT repeat protein